MLKAILWDNDGVLVDTEGLYFQACRETLERLGIRLSEARFIELVLTAMRQNGLSAAECVVIEDSDRGLRAALAAGLRCIVIPQGLTSGLDFTGALRQLTDIRQVPPLIHELMQT